MQIVERFTFKPGLISWAGSLANPGKLPPLAIDCEFLRSMLLVSTYTGSSGACQLNLKVVGTNLARDEILSFGGEVSALPVQVGFPHNTETFNITGAGTTFSSLCRLITTKWCLLQPEVLAGTLTKLRIDALMSKEPLMT